MELTSQMKMARFQTFWIQISKRQFSDMDESSAMSVAMEGVNVVNGLEYKMSCCLSKVRVIIGITFFLG
uniref:Uncharacterized protein n=1 Tax=Helianthus annuus TaxID=4232 RepID=A0A251TAR8_HELAN